MSKFELSIAKDYVPNWDYVDAIRELFQNALDQESLSDHNEMFFDYDESTQVLSIGNKSSVLRTSSLLLGATTKTDNDGLIGKFGEGYKIATLILTREGHPVTFYNYGAKEVWRPRFVKSRRYKADVLTFFIDKKYPWQSTPHHNLTIEVENVTKDQYKKIIESNLHLQDVGDHFVTDKGRILLGDKFSKKVYVNGLYVCEYDRYVYGYDFNPEELDLDRDRKLVDNFSLRWEASHMWMNQTDERMTELASRLISENRADTQFVANFNHEEDNGFKKTADSVYRNFHEIYGNNATPVSSQEELESVSSEHRPIMVEPEHSQMIQASRHYTEPLKVYKLTPREMLIDWLSDHRQSLSRKAISELGLIIDELS